MDDQNFDVPTRLDDPPRLFFWDYDIVLCFVVGVCLGVAIGFMSVGLVSGVSMAWLWSKSRSGRHPGYAMHLLYWNTSFRLFRRTPPSARRRYCG